MPARRISHTTSLSDRLKTFADELKAKASELQPGPEQEELIRKARRADDASHIDHWANSCDLKSSR
jgi:hypothetical protein